jgi:cysteine dioxygenase
LANLLKEINTIKASKTKTIMNQEPDLKTTLTHRSLPAPVKTIIEELNQCATVDNGILCEIVAHSGLTEKDLAPFHTFDHAPAASYGRRLLYSSDCFKILLMSWCNGDFTAIHNHGATQWGCVYFLGQATHRIYEKKNGMLTIGQREGFEHGQIADVCGDMIHIMGNSSGIDFMTLHIYGGDAPADGAEELAEVFAPERNKVFFTAGEAYLNIRNELVKDEKECSGVETETMADYLQLIQPFYRRINDKKMMAEINSFLHQTGPVRE